MSASISFWRDDTPLSAHQTPVWLGIVCDKLTRSVSLLWSLLAKTASPRRSDDERRPLEAGDVGNIVQRFSIMRRRRGLNLAIWELLSGRGLATPNLPGQETLHKITPQPPR
jgi:hypothetical protein